MARFLACCLAFLFAANAWASPELAESFAAQAGVLRAQTARQLDTESGGSISKLSITYETEVRRFAKIAIRLGKWNDDNEGPADLGCIFRGMAAEADLQLKTLKGKPPRAERIKALKRLITLFEDAGPIALDAAAEARARKPTIIDPSPLPCEADADQARALINKSSIFN